MKKLINYQGKKILFYAFAMVAIITGALTVSPPQAQADCLISITLRLGSQGSNVECLQSSLGIPVTGIFDAATETAVLTFQATHQLAADGVFGPMSRAAWTASAPVGTFPSGCTSASGYSATTGLPCSGATNLPAGCQPGNLFSATTGLSCVTGSNLPAGCSTLSGYSMTTGVRCDSQVNDDDNDDNNNDDNDNDDNDDDDDLSGGSGSADYQLMSSLSDEEINEGDEDAEVAGLEIEPEGSDIELTQVSIVFKEAGADGDFEDYADEVSIWLNGELVGRADGNDFTEDNDWSVDISLEDAVIDEGDTGELVVAVSSASDLSTSGDGDSWTVDFREISFEDADGDETSEDPSTSTRTFSFES